MYASHRIIGSEAFTAERVGRRIAAQRPQWRIEAEPRTADRIMLVLSILLTVSGLVASWTGAI